VHESDRNRLLKHQRMLGLAAVDMSEADHAARFLRTMKPADLPLKRALETAVIVSYSRAFTKSSIVTLPRGEYAPADERLARLHDRILDLRDSRSAHTDKEADRQISVHFGSEGSAGVAETFGPVLSPEELELAHELFELQRQRFLEEAIAIEERLA
jgi:hypothetical protein